MSNSRRVRINHRLPLVLVLSAGVLGTGCSGLRIHRPQDLANAQQAQKKLNEADLTQTIAAERVRLSQELADELELVRKHTLARRDARLIYLVGEGDSTTAWNYLRNDIDSRVAELGLTAESFQEVLTALNQLETARGAFQVSAARWSENRTKNPDLPVLSCPPPENVDKGFLQASGLAFNVKTDFEDYNLRCKTLTATKAKIPSTNAAAIQSLKDAKTAAEEMTQAALEALSQARSDYAQAQASSAGEKELTDKRDIVLTKLRELSNLGNQLQGIEKAETALGSINPGLVSAAQDLKATAQKARLELEQGDVIKALSTGLQNEDAQQWLFPYLQSQDAQKFTQALSGIGTTLDANQTPTPVTSLLVRQGQLDLDIQQAQKREAFFDSVIDLLEAQDKAFEVEILHLGKTKRLLNDLDKHCVGAQGSDTRGISDVLKPVPVPEVPQSSQGSPKAKATENPDLLTTAKQEKCREKVFRILVAYSASWTLGRVEQEQIEEQIIGLHQQAALDASEIAFAKWQSLFSLPINQMVALYETGLRSQDVLELFNLLGLGWIGAGVN